MPNRPWLDERFACLADDAEHGFNGGFFTQFVGGNKPSLDSANEYGLEAYATLRRRVAAVGPGRWFYHDLVLSLDAPKSNVA